MVNLGEPPFEVNSHMKALLLGGLLLGGLFLRFFSNAFTTSDWAATTTGMYLAVVIAAFYMADPSDNQKAQLLRERHAIQTEIDATRTGPGNKSGSRKSGFVRKAAVPVKFADDMYTDGLKAEEADLDENFGKNCLTPGAVIARKGKRERERKLYTGRTKGRGGKPKRNTSATSADEQERIYADMNHAD
mmetsp:Transcript_15489/g.40934  ORF Transcript_15489/g.40934 Transcript_15489/m.40934 type:complete len:189 (+) Transcript_15489:119-685(+)